MYGELLDCFDGFRRCELTPAETRDLWPAFRGQVDAVAARWREPDRGIREMRSAPQHFVHSKAMAWVALDRGISAAEEVELPADLAGWRREREAVREEIMRLGYDEDLGTFVQSFGGRRTDAANLLLPMFGFIDARPGIRGKADIRVVAGARDSLGIFRRRDGASLRRAARQLSSGADPAGASQCRFGA